MNNGTVLDSGGHFLLDRLAEVPQRCPGGPDKAIESLVVSVKQVLRLHRRTGHPGQGRGLTDSAGQRGWRDLVQGRHDWVMRLARFRHPGRASRTARSPVIYNNDGTRPRCTRTMHGSARSPGSGVRWPRSSAPGSAAGLSRPDMSSKPAGMAGELGHVPIPLDDLLDAGQPMPSCNCGQAGHAESVASLTGIQGRPPPYWLTRYRGHELSGLPTERLPSSFASTPKTATRWCLAIFRQQAIAIGRLFTIAANFSIPTPIPSAAAALVEAASHFRDWFFAQVRAHTVLREEQARAAEISLVPHLDMAGARGSAYAARDWLIGQG